MDRECEISNCEAFAANPTFREQFDMELELLQVGSYVLCLSIAYYSISD